MIRCKLSRSFDDSKDKIIKKIINYIEDIIIVLGALSPLILMLFINY